jgi:hypothetical protein
MKELEQIDDLKLIDEDLERLETAEDEIIWLVDMMLVGADITLYDDVDKDLLRKMASRVVLRKKSGRFSGKQQAVLLAADVIDLYDAQPNGGTVFTFRKLTGLGEVVIDLYAPRVTFWGIPLPMRWSRKILKKAFSMAIGVLGKFRD